MLREQKAPLKERARGRWRGVLPLLGVSPKVLNGKHHPCPVCGGKDRFRFDDRDGTGTFFCSGACGPGDGISLVMAVNNLDFKGAADKIETLLGEVAYIEPPKERSQDDKREAQRAIWNSGRRIQKDDPAGRYLVSRLGDLTFFPRCLRLVDRVKYVDDRSSWHPAMVAMVQDPDGVPVNVHRTYLSKEGRKADVPEVRKVMAGDIPKGSAIRLFPHYEDVLGVAEGIETAWAAHLLFQVPVWSTMNAGMLADWEPPKDVKKIIIFGDHDKSFTGQWAAYALAKRLSGLKDRPYEVDVRLPEQMGQDWLNVWDEIALA